MKSGQSIILRLTVCSILASTLALSGCTTETGILANTQPVSSSTANADNYQAYGNSPLNISTASGVLTNDSAAQVTAYDANSTQGGTVAMNIDGSFSYNPALSFTGSDTFTYTVDSVSVATVTISVIGPVWYVKNNVVNGNGSFSSPFNNLASAETAALAGHIIFVYEGNGTSSNQNAGITLLNDQQLIGEGSGLSIGSNVIVAAGNKPLIRNTGGDTVVIANRNIIKGLKIDGDNDDGIDGDLFSDLTIDNVEVFNSGNTSDHGLELSNILSGTISITNSKINGNTGDGANILIDDAEIVTLNITGSEFSGNGVDGLDLNTSDTAQVTLVASASSFSSNSSGEGVKLNLNDSTVNTVSLTSNTISLNNQSGIKLDADDNSKLTLHIDLNTMDANAALNGISADLLDNAKANIFVQTNDIKNHGSDYGYYLNAHGNAEIKAKIDANVFTANTADAVRTSSSNTAKLCTELTNNVATGSSNSNRYRFDRVNFSTQERFSSGNTGVISTSGAVSSVGSCPDVIL